MKKLFYTILLTGMLALLLSSSVYATDAQTDIPEMSLEQLIMSMQARQGKVDIIKKNNVQITELKEELKAKIIVAAEKVNNLKLNISSGTVSISDDEINELKSLLEFLQQSTKTLNEDAEKVSKEIDAILDLIQTRGMELGQYDLIIEKQNLVIVNMKDILSKVNKI